VNPETRSVLQQDSNKKQETTQIDYPTVEQYRDKIVSYWTMKLPEGSVDKVEIENALAAHAEWLQSLEQPWSPVKGCRLVVADHDLRGINLEGLDLRGADFSGANLEGACFRGCQLSLADFSGANLKGADFSEAELEETSFDGANITDANLPR